MELLGKEVEEFLGSLHLRAFRKGERILYVDAKVSSGAFDFSMAEQYLYGTQVACLFIDDGCLGSAKRMRPVVFPA